MQAEIMSRTDILVSVHGAQLTNMIFMSPGGRVMEMFPKGWLELAGHGQFIYKHLAEWLGVSHEGYWRDLDHADCPFGNDNVRCMTHFKDLAVGINVTHISAWLRHVVTDFNAMIGELKKPVQERTKPEVEVQQDSDRCACRESKYDEDLRLQAQPLPVPQLPLKNGKINETMLQFVSKRL